jgi:hypothetical protein
MRMEFNTYSLIFLQLILLNLCYVNFYFFFGIFGRLVMIIVSKEKMDFLSGTQGGYSTVSDSPLSMGGTQTT